MELCNLSNNTFKILLMGDSGVGKTCLLTKYTDEIFSDITTTTIGVDFRIKTLTINDSSVKLQIWDTAGLEKFMSIIMGYYRGAHGVILAFDLTNLESFFNIQKWIDEIKRAGDEFDKPPCMILVGTKSDLNKRKVSVEKISEFCKNTNIQYIETSSKSGVGVEMIFIELAKKLKGDNFVFSNNSSSVSIDETENHTKINMKKCCFIS